MSELTEAEVVGLRKQIEDGSRRQSRWSSLDDGDAHMLIVDWLRLHAENQCLKADAHDAKTCSVHLCHEREQLRAELRRRDAALDELEAYCRQHGIVCRRSKVRDIIRRAREQPCN